MGIGFGALKEMNDSMKRNRELLKANKKNPFEKPDFRAAKIEVLEDTIKASPEELQKIREATIRANRQDTIKRLIVLGIISAIVIVIAAIVILQ